MPIARSPALGKRPSASDQPQRLAGKLARILLDVHGRGVLMRDLTPRNIVVDGDAVTLIDFGESQKHATMAERIAQVLVYIASTAPGSRERRPPDSPPANRPRTPV